MEKIKKIYIAGKITGLDREEYLQNFKEVEEAIKGCGFTAVNPTCLPEGLEYQDYMHICYSMIDVVDAVYFLTNWRNSNGAINEYHYAKGKGKELFFDIRDIDEGYRNIQQPRMSDMQ